MQQTTLCSCLCDLPNSNGSHSLLPAPPTSSCLPLATKPIETTERCSTGKSDASLADVQPPSTRERLARMRERATGDGFIFVGNTVLSALVSVFVCFLCARLPSSVAVLCSLPVSELLAVKVTLNSPTCGRDRDSRSQAWMFPRSWRTGRGRCGESGTCLLLLCEGWGEVISGAVQTTVT
eukprot:1262747-Rhodomonas_salina.1